MDKIFVLDNFNIVLDKKYFVRADGRGISLKFLMEDLYLGAPLCLPQKKFIIKFEQKSRLLFSASAVKHFWG